MLCFFYKNHIFAFKFANSIFKMLDKTSGIVLGSIPYNDRTQFVHIYTEKFGKVSYKTSISTKRTAKTRLQRLLFIPLTKLDLDVEHSNSSEFQQIKEASIISTPLNIEDGNPTKHAQCLYIAELIDKSIKEVESNPQLWNFLSNCIDIFLLPGLSSNDFHLLFTAKLCIYLGFGINESEYTKGDLFDLKESQFTSKSIGHEYYLNSISAEYLHRLLASDFTNINQLNLTNQERSIMLDILIAYIRLHIPEIGDIKSIDVLKAIYT